MAGMGLAVLAGVAGGILLVLLDHVSNDAVIWPVAGMRLASIAMLLLAIATMKVRWRPSVQRLPLVLMTGILLLGMLRRQRAGPARIGFESVLVLALYAVSATILFV